MIIVLDSHVRKKPKRDIICTSTAQQNTFWSITGPETTREIQICKHNFPIEDATADILYSEDYLDRDKHLFTDCDKAA